MASKAQEVLIAGGIVLLCHVSAIADPCTPNWDPAVGIPGMDGWIEGVIVYDDGSGPSVFVGGGFVQVGDEPIATVARWDGSQWHPVIGESGSRIFNNVNEFAIYDDGSGPSLYAATAVEDANSILRSGVAKWDGSEWTVVGICPSRSIIETLAVYDDGQGEKLYAGGTFAFLNGMAMSHLAKWDGTSWSDVGGGVSSGALTPVMALEVFDDGTGPALFVGGWYISAGDVTCNSVAKWDGKQWSPLGAGLGGYPFYCSDLEVYDDGRGAALYVGGAFHSAGSVPARYMAKWDGHSWSALGDGVQYGVLTLEVFDDGTGSGPALVAGGFISEAGGIPVNYIAKWDGRYWSSMYSTLSLRPNDMAVFDDGSGESLFIGGHFSVAEGAPANRIIQYRSCINGDFDVDRDVDMADFMDFVVCYGGAGRPPADACDPFVDADFDADGDVDLSDYATFSRNYTGAR